MKEKEWIEIEKKVMDLRQKKRIPEAIKLLKKTLRLIRNSKLDRYDAWQEGEALTLIALFLEDLNLPKESAQYYLKAAIVHRDWAKSHRGAASERFARAALALFRLGQDKKAFDISKEAFDLARFTIDPSPTYEELLQKVRGYHFKRMEKRKK